MIKVIYHKQDTIQETRIVHSILPTIDKRELLCITTHGKIVIPLQDIVVIEPTTITI